MTTITTKRGIDMVKETIRFISDFNAMFLKGNVDNATKIEFCYSVASSLEVLTDYAMEFTFKNDLIIFTDEFGRYMLSIVLDDGMFDELYLGEAIKEYFDYDARHLLTLAE